MAQSLNNLSAWKLVSGFLNQENVPVLGSPLASPSGSIIQPYGGMLGTKAYLSTKQALTLSDVTNVGTLFAGEYQCIQVDPNAAGTVARGTVLFWKDFDNNIVTPDVASAVVTGKIAGIAIGTLTKGNFGFMQVSGKVIVKFRAALTKVAADGDLVVVDQTPTNTGDVLADATGLTSVTTKAIIGVALEAPTNAGLKLVLLRVAMA